LSGLSTKTAYLSGGSAWDAKGNQQWQAAAMCGVTGQFDADMLKKLKIK
jgi:hypothetical protein